MCHYILSKSRGDMQLNLLGFVTFPVKMGLLNMSLELFSEAWFWSCRSKCILEKMVFVSTESYYSVLMRLSQCLPGRIHSTYELECNYILSLWRLNDPLTRRGLWLGDLISINALTLNTCNEAISPTFHMDVPKQDSQGTWLSPVRTDSTTWNRFWDLDLCLLFPHDTWAQF